MKIETKFDIGDKVLIRGKRYTVCYINVQAYKERAPVTYIHGETFINGGKDCIGDCDIEENVVVDPHADN